MSDTSSMKSSSIISITSDFTSIFKIPLLIF
jgi:hypothetical protein